MAIALDRSPARVLADVIARRHARGGAGEHWSNTARSCSACRAEFDEVFEAMGEPWPRL